MKKMLILWLLLQPCFMLAWQGDVSSFQFLGETFTLQAPAVADTAYLATPSRVAVNAQWQATVHLQYVPSSSNVARIYLMADTVVLTSPLNGYYVQVGGAKKTISLYKQSGKKHTLLLSAPADVLWQAPVDVHVRITRNQEFQWQLYYALGAGAWLSTSCIIDPSFTQNKAWGMWCKYTKTRNEAFAFSYLSAQGDTCVVPFYAPIDSLYITEILYDPYPDGVDFVELYNASAQEVMLSQCTLSNGKKQVELPAYTLLPGTYVALTPSDSIVKEQYPHACAENLLPVPSMPNFVNGSGRVELLCGDVVVDSLLYSDDFHHTYISDTEGYSLERVRPEGKEWFSAASTVMATPGCENSQSSMLPDAPQTVVSEQLFWLSDSWFSPQEQYLNIYHALEEGVIANAWVYNLQGVPVYRLYNNAYLPTQGSVYWDGRDDAGNPCSVGIYVVVVEYTLLDGKVHRVKLPVALGV